MSMLCYFVLLDLDEVYPHLFRESKKHPQYTQPVSNLELSVISSLVYCKSNTLNHAATEAGYTRIELKTGLERKRSKNISCELSCTTS
uniref:Uncharacterized protein n=1 Tax=Timema genevievae TaxID=629358 RepID=A0A7R9JYV8_TIMGE|nr:unnamed protein product [Timema genevievae]